MLPCRHMVPIHQCMRGLRDMLVNQHQYNTTVEVMLCMEHSSLWMPRHILGSYEDSAGWSSKPTNYIGGILQQVIPLAHGATDCCTKWIHFLRGTSILPATCPDNQPAKLCTSNEGLQSVAINAEQVSKCLLLPYSSYRWVSRVVLGHWPSSLAHTMVPGLQWRYTETAQFLSWWPNL